VRRALSFRWPPIAIAALLLLLANAGGVRAHEPSARGGRARELIRIQGHRGTAPEGVQVTRTLELTVLGEPHALHATEWQSFQLAGGGMAKGTDASQQLTLQGGRAMLRRFRDARPDQLVTLLAERREGSSDLFLVALDMCPPN
jgi:hypothetical protein